MQSKINDDGGRRLDALMQELRGQLGMSFSSKPLLTQRAPYDSLLAQQLLRSLGNPSSDEQEIVFKQTASHISPREEHRAGASLRPKHAPGIPR